MAGYYTNMLFIFMSQKVREIAKAQEYNHAISSHLQYKLQCSYFFDMSG